MSKPRVIVVDDDASVREMMADWLEERGMRASTASDAMQAVIQARSVKPMLIVSDLIMPQWGTGADVLMQLRSDDRTRGIAVVFLTGLSPEEARKILPHDPRARLLYKPVDWALLAKAVHELAGFSLKEQRPE